jgi:VWFA-related protein
MKKTKTLATLAVLFAGLCWFVLIASAVDSAAQSPAESVSKKTVSGAKPMTIPIGIRVRGSKPEPELQLVDLTVSEDGELQTILSIRAMGTSSPITLAVLVQDDVVPSIGNEIKSLADFIRRLPRGSRVLVGYIKTGTLEIRQKFTTDLEKAAKSLRTPLSQASAAPFNPYVEVIEGINRFESQPSGRRAMLLVSDGLDISRGAEPSSASQSVDLQRAINRAQKRSVAVYSFYTPTVGNPNSQFLNGIAQGSLQKLSEETGGRAFFQGTGAPVSFDPFFRELSSSLDRQIALTYLSTHPAKGFHRLQIRSSDPGVEVEHPSGYTR